MSRSVIESVNRLFIHSFIHSVSHSFSQSVSQSFSLSVRQSVSHSFIHSVSQSVSQSVVSQSVSQSVSLLLDRSVLYRFSTRYVKNLDFGRYRAISDVTLWFQTLLSDF